ncbi:Aste57867_10816 [Aphanomyces stellatus]|uniref:Aste57867_10816 protein n=1 Tax=Aphanomyces stellatus TaxID=120398 RepID=A0A485KSH3_9STRA|nr:hypothetical protein As57867_010776 [Aphanomyces stellatus]VFT87685.1 Aste57867_10816 [Aphanomyces stellatus]
MKRKGGPGGNDELLTPTQMQSFRDNGYILLPNVLNDKQLLALREECDDLNKQTTPDELVELGCVLDIFASANRSNASRTQAHAYTELRRALLGHESPRGILDLIFDELPDYMTMLLPRKGANDHVSDLYFFNEHYVAKPPASKVEFRWHQVRSLEANLCMTLHKDDTEQLGMCVHRESVPWYLSAWCALDDVTTENGALQFRPINIPHDEDDPFQDVTPPVVASAGSVLIFRSDIWHFSAANTTDTVRRAFYVQYSPCPITARPQSPTPLCCAIPMELSSFKSKNQVPRSSDDRSIE